MEADEVAELRQLEGERLDELQRTHWQGALAGDLDAGRMVLKIMERRSRLFGLDASSKDAAGQMTSVEFAEQFVQLVSALDPQGLAEAISQLPGGPSAAVEFSRDVLLAHGDSQAPDGYPVVDGTTELVGGGSVVAGRPNSDLVDDDGEPWSNL